MISELRETQQHTDAAQNPQPQQVNGSHTYGSPPESPSYTPTPGLLTHEVIESCAECFIAHMHPTMPILYREQLQQAVSEMCSSLEAYCLITALCAFILIQPGIPAKVSHVLDQPAEFITNPRMGQALMDETIRVRKSLDFIENPTVDSVITSFFLFGCGFGLNRHNTAWNHLREATGQAHSLGLQDEQTYLFGDAGENSQRRKVFWLLFVTER